MYIYHFNARWLSLIKAWQHSRSPRQFQGWQRHRFLVVVWGADKHWLQFVKHIQDLKNGYKSVWKWRWCSFMMITTMTIIEATDEEATDEDCHILLLLKSYKTQSRLMSWYEYWKWVKVKVVKCQKWNEYNLMYIFHKQCEIMQKNRRISSNGQFHCFHYVW